MAPLAVKVVFDPEQIVAELGVMVKLGNAFTVTVIVLVCVQLAELVLATE